MRSARELSVDFRSAKSQITNPTSNGSNGDCETFSDKNDCKLPITNPSFGSPCAGASLEFQSLKLGMLACLC